MKVRCHSRNKHFDFFVLFVLLFFKIFFHISLPYLSTADLSARRFGQSLNKLNNSRIFIRRSILLNVINETTGKEASAVIPEKVFDQYTLSLTQGSARLILVVVVVIIPLLIGIAGLCVLLWRKNK